MSDRLDDIVALATRSDVFAGLLFCERVPAAVLIELDQRRWAVYPDPLGTENWLVAMCSVDGHLIPGSQLWLPMTPEDPDGCPVASWLDFVNAARNLPDTWHGRRAGLLMPLLAATDCGRFDSAVLAPP